jgi:hypothetical protein
MSNEPAKTAAAIGGDIIESVIVKGDLAQLTPKDRVIYYNRVCRSLGLNPYTQPLAYMSLQGRLQLYAKRDCADQLRQLRGISIEIVSQGWKDDLFTVHVQATDAHGRRDEDIGVVPLPESMKDDVRSNAIMKAITKAKRRVTLSICGLGFLDETEVASIADARAEPAPSEKQLKLADKMQDEIPFGAESNVSAPTAAAPARQEISPSRPGAAATNLSVEDMAREAAQRGPEVLREFFNKRSPADKKRLRAIEAELIKLYPVIKQEE